MHGVLDKPETRYGAAVGVMKEMGWSWQDYQDAPFDLVEEIEIRMAAEAEWTQKKTDFDRQTVEQRSAEKRHGG
jgi:hypothetical protein